MTTVSYPAVGEEGYSADQWRAQFESFEGIINDSDNTALIATVNDGANTITIAPGKVQVAGYVLEVTVAEVLNVSTAAATYWVVAQYDPALNVADGGGDADPLGPCRLQLVSGTPSTAGAKAYVTLYKFTRVASQLLSDAFATREDRRRHLAPQLHAYNRDTSGRGYLETPDIGTTVRESSTGFVWVWERAPGDDDPAWRNSSIPVRIALDKPTSLVAVDTSPNYIVYPDKHISCLGTLKRSSGAPLNNGSDVKLATFPAGQRPIALTRWPVLARFQDGSRGFVGCYMASAGDLYMDEETVPFATPWADTAAARAVKKNINWIALDSISYYTEQ